MCKHEHVIAEEACGYDVIKDMDIEGVNYICQDCGECLNEVMA